MVAASPLVRLAEFSVGCGSGYLFVLLQKGRPSWLRAESLLWTAVELAVLLALTARAALPWSWAGMPPAGWPIVPLLFGALIFLAGYSRSRPRIGAFLEIRVLRTLGRISYSFYLFHDLVLWNVYNRLPDVFPVTGLSPQLAAGLLAFVLTVVVAAASYHLIERKATAAISRTVLSLPRADDSHHASSLVRG